MARRSFRFSGLQREKLRRNLRAGGGIRPSRGIDPRPDVEVRPLSPGQERLWFLDQLEPDNASFNLTGALRLDGRIHLPALIAGLKEICRRHETLRCAFVTENGRPHQVLTLRPELNLVDLGGLPKARKARQCRKLSCEESRRPFDLARGPLLRFVLVALEERRHVLIVTPHHIIWDGWSSELFLRELGALYGAFSRGLPSPLVEPSIQYCDFAAWQRARLESELLESHLEYWRRRLAAASVLELPTDRPRSSARIGRGRTLERRLPAELPARLKRLARDHKTTLFVVALTAFVIVLHRLTGQRDVVIGTPVAGRMRRETTDLIGFFVNMLALRTTLSGSADISFSSLTGSVRQTTLEAFAHQEAPFEKIVEDLQPGRDLDRSPLFQVTLLMDALAEVDLPGLESEMLAWNDAPPPYDLVASFQLRNQGDAVGLRYRPELFDDSTIQRFLRYFQEILESAVDGPGRGVAELPLFAAAERHQVVAEWGSGPFARRPTPYRRRFEAGVQRHPERTAVVVGDVHVSYGELESRAERLATHLRRLGVGPETTVGLAMERSAETVVALLAIFKAGGAYLPLDTSFPARRLRFMIEDSRCEVLLADAVSAARLSPGDVRVVSLEADREVAARQRPSGSRVEVDLLNLAYVIYTSGSTGRPKGVQISQGAMANFLESMARRPGLRDDDVVLAVTTLSFDISVLELFLPLLVGARLELVRGEEAVDGFRLIERWSRSKATVLQATPSTWQMMLTAGWRGGRPLLALCGGEPMPAELARRLVRRGATVWNMYGPTETTVWSAIHPVASVPLREPPLIGRPIVNTGTYVLDRRLRAQAPGVSGELFIGGAGLARGYRSRPAATATRFVPDPNAAEPGARLYRTGDLARWRRDGRLECLGRLDHQVKVRGLRIELGEVEAVLAAFPTVREAVVVAHQIQDGAVLVAYVVPDGDAVDDDALRRFLGESLPDYMVPSRFVSLAALPLLPNGKVDRRALPEPSWDGSGEREGGEPRSELEAAVLEIWGDVLGVERVGIHDDFFALGGHSLIATRVLARVRHVFGVEMELRHLFEAPTAARFVPRLAEALESGVPALAGIKAGSGELGDLPLSFAQRRLWFLQRLRPESSAYNMSSTLALSGTLSPPALASAVLELTRRHQVLRTRYPVREGRPVQDLMAPESALPVVDLEALPESAREREAARRVGEERRRPFDLERQRPLRMTVLRLAAERHWVLTVVHHIAADGGSIPLFAEELAALYGAFARDRRSPLPEPSVQYRDFAAWQHRELAPLLEEQTAYWRRRLGDAGPALRLPEDRLAGAGSDLVGSRLSSRIPAPTAARLRELGCRYRCTVFMLLLSVLGVLLRRLSGQDDVIVGAPVAGRTRPEVEKLIGCFVNTLALRLDVSGDPSFAELVARVRERVLEAHRHQDVPFERLVEVLQPARHLDRNPWFEVLLNMVGTSSPSLDFPGLESRVVEPEEAEEAKFALTLYVHEDEGGGLALHWVYRQGLFSRARVAAMADQLSYLIEQVTSAPEGAVGELSLRPPSHAAVLPDPTLAIPEPAYPTVIEGVGAVAARFGDRTAVTWGATTWSYGELWRRSTALARAVLASGVARGEVVAVSGGRSCGMVAAMTGVLASGGVLLTVDSGLPMERRRALVRASRARLLLDVGGEAGDLGLARIVVDPGRGEVAGDVGERPAVELPWPAGDDPAYLFFTSGSSGVPKGILGCHKGLGHFVAWQRERFAVGAGDRCAQLTSLSFDAVLRDVFLALTAGSELCLPDVSGGPGEVLPWARRMGVTVIHTVPSLGRAWLRQRSAEVTLPALRWTFFSGESLDSDLVSAWRESFPSSEVVNFYGPTETTLIKSFYPVPRRPLAGVQPAGTALPETQALVLATGDRPCGIGEPGEIVLRTPFRTLGYVNAADQSWRFAPNPFRADARDVVYRTGDLGRYRADGELEILGRLDEQVKVRGVRIELGEIESVLERRPEIREVAVVARRPGGGDGPRVVAYYVAEPGASPTVTALRTWLRRSLPEESVPAGFVQLAALPLNANGKLDRRALPEESQERPELEEGYVAPRTALERSIAELWQAVLRLERVGARDNFFDLGGHSLLLIEVQSGLERLLGRAVPIVELFRCPTVQSLAERLAAAETPRPRSLQDVHGRAKARLASRARRRPQPRGRHLSRRLG